MNQIIALSLGLLLVCLPNLFAADAAAGLPDAGLSTPASFQIRNKKFGDLLRPRDANSAIGTPIVLYPAQPWKCMTWKFHAAGDSAYQLQNHFTSKTFAAEINAGNQAPQVTQVAFGKDAATRPVWRFTKMPDGSYRITDAKSGNALTAIKTEAATDVRIVLQPWQEKDEQKWELLPIDPKQLTM